MSRQLHNVSFYKPIADVDVVYQEMNDVYQPRTKLGREQCEKHLKDAYYQGRHYIVAKDKSLCATNALISAGVRIGAVGWVGAYHA